MQGKDDGMEPTMKCDLEVNLGADITVTVGIGDWGEQTTLG
jgi:hypothetical protein